MSRRISRSRSTKTTSQFSVNFLNSYEYSRTCLPLIQLDSTLQRVLNFLNIIWFKGLVISDNISERDPLVIIKKLWVHLYHVKKTQTVLNLEQSAVNIDHYLEKMLKALIKFAFALIMVSDILYYKTYFFSLVIALLYSFLDTLWGPCERKNILQESTEGAELFTVTKLCGDRLQCRFPPYWDTKLYCACK